MRTVVFLLMALVLGYMCIDQGEAAQQQQRPGFCQAWFSSSSRAPVGQPKPAATAPAPANNLLSRPVPLTTNTGK